MENIGYYISTFIYKTKFITENHNIKRAFADYNMLN